jgi:Flp pilus assembly pilin Flp
MNRINQTLRHIRGQGLTEYIIIVALIAVAAIGVYTMFGDVVKKQTGAMAAGLAGDNGKAIDFNGKAGETITNNEDKVTNVKGLSNFTKDNALKK